MLGRLFSFALFQVVGAVFGWWFGHQFMALDAAGLVPMLLGALVSGYFWHVLDVALSAGLAFAGNNVIARAGQSIPIRSKTVAVFIGCGVLSAAWVAVQGAVKR